MDGTVVVLVFVCYYFDYCVSKVSSDQSSCSKTKCLVPAELI